MVDLRRNHCVSLAAVAPMHSLRFPALALLAVAFADALADVAVAVEIRVCAAVAVLSFLRFLVVVYELRQR